MKVGNALMDQFVTKKISKLDLEISGFFCTDVAPC